MIKFNSTNKKDTDLTYGDCLDPIFKAKTKKEALQYKEDYANFVLEELKRDKKNKKKSAVELGLTALGIAEHNIGYYAGYGSNDDRKRIEKLFEVEHPIFGSIEKNGAPTSQEAFNMGLEISKKLKKK